MTTAVNINIKINAKKTGPVYGILGDFRLSNGWFWNTKKLEKHLSMKSPYSAYTKAQAIISFANCEKK